MRYKLIPAPVEHVYVMTAGPKNVKIGATCDPVKRRNALSRYDGHRVELVQSWHRPDTARAIEWLALWRLRAYRDYGEWCRTTGESGVRAVLWAMRTLESGIVPITKSKLPGSVRAALCLYRQ